MMANESCTKLAGVGGGVEDHADLVTLLHTFEHQSVEPESICEVCDFRCCDVENLDLVAGSDTQGIDIALQPVYRKSCVAK